MRGVRIVLGACLVEARGYCVVLVKLDILLRTLREGIVFFAVRTDTLFFHDVCVWRKVKKVFYFDNKLKWRSITNSRAQPPTHLCIPSGMPHPRQYVQ